MQNTFKTYKIFNFSALSHTVLEHSSQTDSVRQTKTQQGRIQTRI